MGVGMPETLYLKDFGDEVRVAFGHIPYHVGSSVQSKEWRDVDVRLILPDEEYEALGFGDPNETYKNLKWLAMCKAFAALGKQMTGLPIDFQIQQQTLANEKFKGIRSALFNARILMRF